MPSGDFQCKNTQCEIIYFASEYNSQTQPKDEKKCNVSPENTLITVIVTMSLLLLTITWGALKTKAAHGSCCHLTQSQEHCFWFLVFLFFGEGGTRQPHN